MSKDAEPEVKVYTCERCAATTPATQWGPGWITCPACGFVVRTVFEKKHGLRDPSQPQHVENPNP